MPVQAVEPAVKRDKLELELLLFIVTTPRCSAAGAQLGAGALGCAATPRAR